ncbi:hypothetical protein BMW23_0228 [Bodo saltans virus]|uniref:Uncharacterized protein n=1 Tax=Bodo saltans virus TaxID=2024608 RepID=A0A2H4UTV4_9VIRU|nr:hypothetical protein QJ851_gp0223 [Bodo saltans virus]ATZ80286.1 hypothetical protein BMW23_0228 [Bodo saltans virus]
MVHGNFNVYEKYIFNILYTLMSKRMFVMLFYVLIIYF